MFFFYKKTLKKVMHTLSFCVALSGPLKDDPTKWIEYAEQQMRGDHSTGSYSLKITTPEWTRELELESKIKGHSKAIIFIKSPIKEKGIGTLRVDERITNYFPKLKRTVDVSPSMLLSNWMGSGFSNDDLLRTSSLHDDYNHKFIGKAVEGSEELKIVESLLKEKSKALWPKILYYASAKDCLPRKQEFYDKKGTLQRTLLFSEVKKVDGHLLPTQWQISESKNPEKVTVLTYKDVSFSKDVTDQDFTLQVLTR